MNIIAPLAVDMFLAACSDPRGDMDQQTDNQGQIVIYTGMYRWTDGTVRDVPQPEGRLLDASTEEVEEEYENVESDEVYESEPPTLKNPPRQDHWYDGPCEQSKVA